MSKETNSRVKRTQRDYNLGFKLALVSEVEKGNYTYKQIQKAYGIQGRSTVLVWLRKYGTLDWNNPNPSPDKEGYDNEEVFDWKITQDFLDGNDMPRPNSLCN